MVTYRRPRLATQVVENLLRDEQLPADRVVLVVNGEGGLDDPVLEAKVHVVRLRENLGPAAGFREGMRFAAALPGVDWFYLCEDDVSLFDLPSPRLARLIGEIDAVSAARRRPVGAVVAYGRDLNRRTGHTTPHEVTAETGFDAVDAASWGASLVARTVFERGVLPDDDYFFGYEDFDFWYQLRRAGFDVLLDRRSAARVASQMSLAGRDAAFAGQRPTDEAEPWRAFYVARNYFLLARRHGRPSWIAAHLVYSARRLQLAPNRPTRLAIMHGLIEGIRGAVGKNEHYVRGLGELAASSAASPDGAATTEKAVRARAPRRVVHVLPRDVARGAQVFVRDLCALLDAPDEEHVVLTLFDAPSAVLPSACSLGVPMGRARSAGFDPRVPMRLSRALKDLRPDVVVAHGGESLKYLAFVRGPGAPLLYLAIGTASEHATSGARNRFYRLLLSRAQLVGGVSTATLDEAQHVFRVPAHRTVLLPNGRDASRYHPALEQRSDSTEVTLIFVGHLTAGKRPERFLEAVGELRRRGQDVRGLIVGDGPLEQQLRRAATDRVQLLGRRDDVPELLRAADIFVFCSLPEGEGLPGVLIEAALSGLPIVATRVPGASDVVIPGVTGFLVPPDDSDALVAALARLVGEPNLRRSMGGAARRHASASFDLDSIARRWRSVLDDLVAGAVR